MATEPLPRASFLTYFLPTSTPAYTPRSSAELSSHFPFPNFSAVPFIHPQNRPASEDDKLECGKYETLDGEGGQKIAGDWDERAEEGESERGVWKYICYGLMVLLFLLNFTMPTAFPWNWDDDVMEVREVHFCLVSPLAVQTWKVVDADEFRDCPTMPMTLYADALGDLDIQRGDEIVIEWTQKADDDDWWIETEQSGGKKDNSDGQGKGGESGNEKKQDVFIGKAGNGINAGFGGPWRRVRK